MAKLIKLPNGKFIKADAIVSVGELWLSMGKWCYSIAYHNNEQGISYHTVELDPNFVKDEMKAITKQDQFVQRVNENL